MTPSTSPPEPPQFALALPHGITLACRGDRTRWDAPGAPRVLLLHGFPEAAFVWDGVRAGLAAQGVAAIAPNLRGFGGSSAPAAPEAYRPRHTVADVVAALEALGCGPAAPLDLLVAHDWGGALAWNLAAARPDLLRRLLILNAPHPAAFLRELRSSAEQQAASAYMNFLCRPDAARLLAEDGYRRLFGFFGDARWLDAAMRERYRAVWDAGLDAQLNWYRASPLRPAVGAGSPLDAVVLADSAVTVTVPTTVLWGEQDLALRPGLLDGLGRWVPDLEIVRRPEASHWLVHEEPVPVLQAILRLVARARPAG